MKSGYKIPGRIAKAMIAASVPTSLPAGRKFLVIGPHVWGKGDTIEAAYKNARIEGAAVEKSLLLFDVPADAVVDEMGYTTWTWDKDAAKPEPDRELFRFGVKTT